MDVDDGTLRRGGTDLEMAEGGEMNSDAIIDAMRPPAGDGSIDAVTINPAP